MTSVAPGSIIYWKLEEWDLDPQTCLPQIDDLCARSPFDLVVLGLEHCQSPPDSERVHTAVATAVARFREHGRRVVLALDPRNDPGKWVELGPEACLGWVDTIDIPLDEPYTWTSHMGQVYDQFGDHPPVGSRVLTVIAYLPGEVAGTYSRRLDADYVTDLAEPGTVTVTVPPRPGWRALVMVVHQLAFPDVFGDLAFDYHSHLLRRYADIGLSGAAVDEWGPPPQPAFEFGRTWSQPWWSRGLAEAFRAATGGELVDAFLHQQVAPDGDMDTQTAAIRDYFRVLRDRTVEFETHQYDQTRHFLGPDAFVGTHPTWWGLDDANQSVELFRNGFNWWSVRRDLGQTDEFVPMGVRLALARKAGRTPFYNMWYSDGTHDVRTYFRETWRNARYAGRTHHLGYRCEGGDARMHELVSVVQQLGLDDALDQIGAMERRLAGLTPFFGPLVDSSVLVVIGWDAAVDWRNHTDANGMWQFESDTVARGYQVLAGLWEAGFIAELVPDYEPLEVDETGRVRWCGRGYDAAVFVDAAPGVPSARAATVTSAADAVAFVTGLGAAANDIPSGCRLEDGTVIAVSEGALATGNPLLTTFRVADHTLRVEAEDFVAVSADLSRIAAGVLHRLFIDDIDVTSRYVNSPGSSS